MQGVRQDPGAPGSDRGGDLGRRLGDDEPRVRRQRDHGVGVRLDGRDEVGVEEEGLVAVAEPVEGDQGGAPVSPDTDRAASKRRPDPCRQRVGD
jgi:hypothetical protein